MHKLVVVSNVLSDEYILVTVGIIAGDVKPRLLAELHLNDTLVPAWISLVSNMPSIMVHLY